MKTIFTTTTAIKRLCLLICFLMGLGVIFTHYVRACSTDQDVDPESVLIAVSDDDNYAWGSSEYLGGDPLFFDFGDFDSSDIEGFVAFCDMMDDPVTIEYEITGGDGDSYTSYDVHVVWDDSTDEDVGEDPNIYSDPDSDGYIISAYVIETTTVNVTAVQAKDDNHSNRIATSGQTLYLVGTSGATISATGDSGSFPSGCPSWTIDSVAGAQTTPSFDDTSDSSFTAEGFTVGIVRDANGSVSCSSPSLSTTNFDIGNWVPGASVSLAATFDAGTTTWTGERAEVYASPAEGTKVTYSLGVTMSATARVTYPPLSWTFTVPFINGGNPFLAAEVALFLTGSGSLTGSGGYDPSEATPYAGSVTGTGSLTFGAEAFAYAYTGYVSATATGNVSTGVSASARLYSNTLQDQFSWSGLSITGTILIYHDINNPYVNWAGTQGVLNGATSDWTTFYTIPTS